MSSPAKKSFHGRSKTSRTRSGCLQCRRRRVKCDEQKPTCKRCLDGHWPCGYGLQLTWPDEPRVSKSRRPMPASSPQCPAAAAAADKSARHVVRQISLREQHHVPARTPRRGITPPSVPAVFENTTLADFEPSRRHRHGANNGHVREDHVDEETRISTGTTQHQDPAPFGLHAISPLPGRIDMSPLAKRLFSFYVHGMCPRCILLDTDSRSYRNVVIPIALQSSLVFNPLLALTASQMTGRGHDDSASRYYKELAIKYQGHSLRFLAQRITALDRAGGVADSASRSEILGAILMLCLFEVMNNSFRPDSLIGGLDWKIHSAGARQVLESPVLDLRLQTNVEMSSFLGQMLSAHHVLQFTTLSGSSSSSSSSADAAAQAQYWLSKTTPRTFREINYFAGCSNELLAILSDVVRLVRQQKGCGLLEDRGGCGASKAMLESRIDAVVQELPSFARSPRLMTNGGSTTVGTTRMRRLTPEERFPYVAEAYRRATMILVQYLDSEDVLPEENKTIQSSLDVILSDDSMRSALSLPPPGKACRAGPLWPVFIASCHATADESRGDIVGHFNETMVRDGSTCDVLEPMIQVIQNVWEQQDGKKVLSSAAAGEDGQTWRFPWEDVLSRKGWELSW